MGKLSRAAIGSLMLFLSAGTANSIPIPTTPPGLIINFDFLSPPQTPAPPYDALSFKIDFSIVNSGSSVRFDLYGDLDGNDFLQTLATITSSTTGPGTITVTCSGPGSPCDELYDGTFSAGVLVLAGAADFTDASAFASAGQQQTGTIIGQPANGSIPEPASLALFGIGVVGLGLSRRRKLN